MRRLIIIMLVAPLLMMGFKNKSEKEDIPLSQIPFDSMMAKSDIEKGVVRIIDLISPTYEAERTRLQDLISIDQRTLVEESLGFTFEDFILDEVAPKYLTQREEEYNAVVYRYLDSKHNAPTESLIKSMIIKLYKEQKAKENL